MEEVESKSASNEKSTDLHKINGDINGSCDEDVDEPMEVDPVESPIKEKIVSKSQNDEAHDDNEQENTKLDDDKKSITDENSVDGDDESNHSKTVTDDKEISQSSIPDAGDDDSQKANNDNQKANNDSQNANDDSQNANDDPSKMSEDDEKDNSNNTTIESNKNSNSTPKPIQDDEIHNISDSDDEEEEKKKENSNTSIKENDKPPEIEKMDIDSNGHLNNDDDKPVSINSDSDSEEDVSMKDSLSTAKNDTSKVENKGLNGVCKDSDEVHEILSDKEDCIVLDEKDDDVSPQKSSRSRKSAVNVRNFTDAEDDDIQEIRSDDPLHIDSKSQKLTKPMPPLATPPLAPFSNQISIKDARSLAIPPGTTINKSGGQNSFQQQFIQQQTNSKKEPTLVIIDTNSILSGRGGQVATNQALINKSPAGVSVMPIGVPAQGLYPPNMRSSLTPIIPKQMSGYAQSSPIGGVSSLPQLLPALTDDMFVLEAPSFIVPYIYEKPPSDNLKQIVTKIGVELDEQRKKEKADREKEKEKPQKEDDSENEKETKDKDDGGDAAVEKEGADGSESTSSKSKKSKKKKKSGDDSWDELDTSTDDEASDSEQRTKVLIKEVDEDAIDKVKKHIIASPIASNAAASTTTTPTSSTADPVKRTENYFESPLGKFFMNIGINLVQEHVQTDLLRQQKRKCNREGPNPSPQIQMAINSLMKNLEFSRETNEPFKFETKRCEYCNFKSESSLAMANHYETPHMRNYVYKCNFCPFETRPPHDILFHMEACHNIKGRLEKGPHYHQCPNCPWEDNGKSKLARHAVVCAKKFRPEVNLAAPMDWEPPAKIPRIKPKHGLVGTANAYQAMAAQQQRAAATLLQRQQQQQAAQQQQHQQHQQISPATQTGSIRGRNRLMPKASLPNPVAMRNASLGQNALPRSQIPGMNLPNHYSLSTNAGGAAGQFLQVAGTSVALVPNSRSSLTIQTPPSSKGKSSHQQPSISITPLPRQTSSSTTPPGIPAAGQKPGSMAIKPGQSPNGNGKSAFVICEICDGYIRDLDQLRNHMQWIHKIKIHPKMIYNRPPLNCQKCQYRFFTDQGLERHLLGSHGLVTSSMQEAANKAKDAGRCPVCGKVFQWKLLNHVSRDHNMTLKPAHLSYKCTVCTATFGMYKQFENHVYSAHSSVAKKSMERKSVPGSSNSSNSSSKIGDSLLKPLKINDEITIIPQPASKSGKPIEIESHVID